MQRESVLRVMHDAPKPAAPQVKGISKQWWTAWRAFAHGDAAWPGPVPGAPPHHAHDELVFIPECASLRAAG